jgi:hypothetical protein
MRFKSKWVLFVPLVFASLDVAADTYKCVVAGKSVYSDIPCAGGSARVDASTDKVSRGQRYEADVVNQSNRRQLSELQYRASVDRNTPGKLLVVEPDASQVNSQPNNRGRYR